ncbi:DL-endopeptidase inhibitor IseA family protein [Brevibacillus migulae]|uniref:DL-endopeptidase inhibitor IseA family protein n=1 Tax=Brevibacillus migulae TaxID=1644114 RepID=UPI00106DDDBB|nr:DL-endopeptidase inhibitor IseA family protein [Brevibacillus migulae]
MKKQRWGFAAAVVAASVTIGAVSQIPAWAQQTGSNGNVNAAVAVTKSQSVDQVNLRIQQLELALQPETAQEAIELFVKSHESRNGALLFALLTPEQQRSNLATFVEQNWVLGVSSPWVKGYRINKVDEKNETTMDYTVELMEYTSTGFMGTEQVTVSLKKEGTSWRISDYKQVKFTSDIDLQDEKLNERSVLGLVKEAQQRFWYVMSGGKSTGGVVATFRPGAGETDYRYLSEDIGTREKLSSYLEDVYAKSTVNTWLEQQLKQKSLIDDGERLAQPNADGGSLLEWGSAEIIKLEQNGQKATVQAKVPAGESDSETFTISFVYEQNRGWRIASAIGDVH